VFGLTVGQMRYRGQRLLRSLHAYHNQIRLVCLGEFQYLIFHISTFTFVIWPLTGRHTHGRAKVPVLPPGTG
jgi:hypothetical protein